MESTLMKNGFSLNASLARRAYERGEPGYDCSILTDEAIIDLVQADNRLLEIAMVID